MLEFIIQKSVHFQKTNNNFNKSIIDNLFAKNWYILDNQK